MSSSIAILLLQPPPSQCLLTAAYRIWELRGQGTIGFKPDNARIAAHLNRIVAERSARFATRSDIEVMVGAIEEARAAQERMEVHMNNDIQRGLVNFGAS